MILTDSAQLTGTRVTRDGYMVADVRVARGGNIQVYNGSELQRPDMAQVRIYRDPAAIFDARVMSSLAFRPITVTHPPEFVDAENWRDYAVGITGGEITRDGEFIRVPMCLMDSETIRTVQNGTREVSCGYKADIEWTAGTTPDGQIYDARVVSMTGNHVAIVGAGRAGPECRIGDSANSTPTPTPPKPTRKDYSAMADDNTGRAVILVDGFTVETTPQGREAIQRLQTQLNDTKQLADAREAGFKDSVASLNGQIAAARQALADETAKKEGDLAGLKLQHQTALDAANARIAELEQQTSPAALEALAATRAATVAVARRVLGDAFTGQGMSDAEVRRQTVLKAVGATLSDAEAKPQLFFDHVFEAVAATPAPQAPAPARVDPMRMALATNPGPIALDAAKQEPSPLDKHIARLSTAYRNAPANGVI
jgi:hypothetical protein